MALVLRAPAKVNWTLEVLGRRPDGYHEVASVIQALDLHDVVTLEPAAGLAVEGELPGGLASRAAALLATLLGERAAPRQGAAIRIAKAIPEAAGLGGGASDAAAVLRGLNRLWGLGLGRRDLAALAAELGADVPFFLWGGTALAQGKGEIITPLPSPPPLHLAIAVPPGAPPAKTAYMYSLLGPQHYSDGAATRRLGRRLEGGAPPADGDLFNVFEAVAGRAFPALTAFRAAFLEAGAPAVHLAGSGPALFALAPDAAEARRLAQALAERGVSALLAATLTRGEEAL